MEDYYKLFGVQPDADRETIRDAYRAKKSEFDAVDTDAARAGASRLNRAWNVLSDDAQRGRYDDQLAEAKADGNIEDVPFEPIAAPAVTRDRKGRERPARQPRQPIMQETEINGVPLATNKDRGFALAIDAFLLFVLWTAALGFLPAAAEAFQEQEWKAADAQVDVVEAAQDDLDDAEDALDKAEDGGDEDEIAAAKEARDAAKDEVEKQTDIGNDLFTEILPTRRALIGGWIVLALGLTIVPSAFTGRTLGKQLRKIRLRTESGALPGWGASLKHYGIPLGTIGLAEVAVPGIGQFIGLIWLFGVTSFARSPRRQGWHDRIAKTIVAAD